MKPCKLDSIYFILSVHIFHGIIETMALKKETAVRRRKNGHGRPQKAAAIIVHYIQFFESIGVEYDESNNFISVFIEFCFGFRMDNSPFEPL